MSSSFRIYYDDRDPYDGPPMWAPAWGVLLVVERDSENGRRIVANGDYYCWDGRWWAKDFVGMLDYLAQPGPRRVLIGRMVPNERFEAAYRMAEADRDFPARLGYGAFEVNV